MSANTRRSELEAFVAGLSASERERVYGRALARRMGLRPNLDRRGRPTECEKPKTEIQFLERGI